MQILRNSVTTQPLEPLVQASEANYYLAYDRALPATTSHQTSFLRPIGSETLNLDYGLIKDWVSIISVVVGITLISSRTF